MNLKNYIYLNKFVVLRGLQGAVLGFGAPIGWAAIQWFRGIYLLQDIQQNIVLYLYMTIGTVVVFTAFGVYAGFKEKQLERMSIKDPLTNFFNRRYFFSRLREEVLKRKRISDPLTIIYFNIDKFRRVNSQYGRNAGDDTLNEISSAIRKVIRETDLIGRIEGQEFALLISGIDAKTSIRIAERIKNTISSISIPLGPHTYIRVTASFGIASLEPNMDGMHLIKNASKAMFKAKSKGRNCVDIFES